MNAQLTKAWLIAILAILAFRPASACSTFCLKNGRDLVVGKNFDFYTGIGHVIVNKRNVTKTSYTPPGEKPLSWTSRYGSVTFNQMGQEFPFGGMNEKGLVIEQMYLADAVYPDHDERFGLYELQWLQYQLDNAATVMEVVASDSLVRISNAGSGPIHFLLCDAKGNVATIEYIRGRMVVHRESTLPVCALTNDTYDQSLQYANSIPDLSARYKSTPSVSSFDRFAHAALKIRQFSIQDPVDYSFDVLHAVRQDGFTRWKIVYDISNMTIHYQTQNNPARRSLSFAALNFDCRDGALFADIEANTINKKLPFKPLTYRDNFALVSEAIDLLQSVPVFAAIAPPDSEKEPIARYPERSGCGK